MKAGAVFWVNAVVPCAPSCHVPPGFRRRAPGLDHRHGHRGGDAFARAAWQAASCRPAPPEALSDLAAALAECLPVVAVPVIL